jgi:filamentous hemagglutinin
VLSDPALVAALSEVYAEDFRFLSAVMGSGRLAVEGASLLGVLSGASAVRKALAQAGKTADEVAGGAVSSGAESSVNAAKLNTQLTAQEIAGGHAFEKHVLNQGEFKGLGIRTREQFANHIENVINNPTASRQLSGGRTAYWQEPTGTVVIRNPRAVDGGTAFQPVNGRAYFDGLK